MMKKFFVLPFVALTFVACTGNSKTAETADSVATTTEMPVEQVATPSYVGLYQGSFPAADDAVSFATTLDLRADNTFAEEQVPAEGKAKGQSLKTQGTYRVSGDTLILVSDGPERRALVQGDSLQFLNADGAVAPLYVLRKASM